MDYEIVEKIVKSGNSKVLNEWKKISTITDDEFLQGCKWLSEEPEDGGALKNHVTRELGLTPTGVEYLHVVHDSLDMCFYYVIRTGLLWCGELFYGKPKNEKEEWFCDKNGLIPCVMKISINCRERV